MAEFKRLSDVEVVAEPTESANVLIEEDGVIKKAPKTAVGGAGGGNNVLIAAFDNRDNFISASDGFYEAISDMFNKIKFYYIVVCIEHNGEFIYRYSTVVAKMEGGFSVQFDGGYCLNVYQNGEFEYYTVD